MSVRCTLTDDRCWSYVRKERKSSCQKRFVGRCLLTEQMNVWKGSCSNRKIEHDKELKEEELSYEPTNGNDEKKKRRLACAGMTKKSEGGFCG